jgi:excisionase family DNA binding protein
MTLEEVAAFLRVSPSTVYRLLRQHRIPAFKMGSDWRFNQNSIEQWIAAREGENSNNNEGAVRQGQPFVSAMRASTKVRRSVL